VEHGIYLSIVIPAYNEADRLPPYLERVCDYLDVEFPDRYEVIVVDDGSEDTTAESVIKISDSHHEIVLIRHAGNLGKGAAVRSGVLASRGELILFTDADGATPIEYEARLREAISEGADIAVGSRLVGESGIVRSHLRRWGGGVFSKLTRFFLRVRVHDTQCGFKMFRREAGMNLFSLCEINGFIFDAFLIRIAEELRYRVDEVSVGYRDVAGSRFRLWKDPWIMIADLIQAESKVRSVLDNVPKVFEVQPTDRIGRAGVRDRIDRDSILNDSISD
jgi:dolichyl-phosphate beta-glucosyltransferase